MHLTAEFWLPGAPGDRRAGTLQFGPHHSPTATIMQGWQDPPESSHGKNVLTRVDSFDPPRPSQSWQTIPRDLVHGIFEDGKIFSLTQVNDLPGKASIGEVSFHQRSLRATLLVFGSHLTDETAPVTKLVASHALLPLAVTHSGMERKWFNDKNEDGAGFDFAYRVPKSLEVTLDKTTILELVFDAATSLSATTSPEGSHYSMTQICTVRLTFKDPISYIDAWTTYLWPLGRLFEFLTRHRGGYTSTNAAHDDSGPSLRIEHRELRPKLTEDELATKNGVVFHLNHLDDRTEQVIRQWFLYHTTYELALTSGLAATSEVSPEQRTRRHAVALEALSDLEENRLSSKLSAEQWKKMKKPLRALLTQNSIDLDPAVGDIKKALSAITLKEKLNAVVEGLNARGAGIDADVETVLTKIVDVRNNYSHSAKNQTHADIDAIHVSQQFARSMFEGVLVAHLPIRRAKKARILKELFTT